MIQDDAVDALAGAIVDDTEIDWAAAESNAANESQRKMIRNLKLIAAIAELHGSTVVAAPPGTGTWPPSDLDPVHTWGPLHILDQVGHGAYGEVYRAWDTRLNREVALKLLRAELSDDQARAALIIKEARLLARVQHPNVVTIHGAELIDGRAGLWMEFIRGRTLAELLEQGDAFSEAEAIRVGVELCRAVTAVHDAGLIHRDIKSRNVMLADDGRVVLTDFGSGWQLSDGSGRRLAGTPGYMAPELLRGDAASTRSDIYSIGVLLFHLVTRSYPVQGAKLDDLRAAHDRGERIEVRTARPGISRRLAGIIQRAIEPVPDRRYGSVRAMADDLLSLSSRPRLPTVTPVVAAVVALFLTVALAVEWRSRQTGSSGPMELVRAGFARLLPGNPSPIQHPVIVVLPFDNLGTQPESDMLVEGLTVEILNSLAQIEGLEVRARESSFAVKKTTADLREIGRQLEANLFLLGSVRRSGARLRINARLVQSDGTVLWADQFDREFRDVFVIQEEISLAIVNKLQLKLGRGQRRYDTDPLAGELYLQGRALLGRTSAGDLLKAAALFQEVLDRDPRYSPAHAGLANAYALAALPLSSTLAFEPTHAIIRRAAFQAYDLDPVLAETHIALGWVHSRENNWAAAEKAFQEAIRRNPNLTEGYTGYSSAVLQPLARLDDAQRILRQALRNDPRSPDLQREIGVVQILSGEYAGAVDTFERLRTAHPDFPFAGTHLGRALTFAGRAPEALAVLTPLDGRHLGPFKPQTGRAPWLALPYVRTGRRADAQALTAGDTTSDSALAVIYAALGDRSKAFAALDRLAAAQPHHLGRMLIMPELSELRDDPRFATLRARCNLPAR
jgi:serine/threonine-protein kinase